MNDLYNNNADFREYVNRYCKTYKLTVEEALSHRIVKEVAMQMQEGRK